MTEATTYTPPFAEELLFVRANDTNGISETEQAAARSIMIHGITTKRLRVADMAWPLQELQPSMPGRPAALRFFKDFGFAQRLGITLEPSKHGNSLEFRELTAADAPVQSIIYGFPLGIPGVTRLDVPATPRVAAASAGEFMDFLLDPSQLGDAFGLHRQLVGVDEARGAVGVLLGAQHR